MDREKLTILIPTFNVEKIIRECLESVKWADEILVCDSFSTDRTVEICKKYTNRIIQHEYINSALQKNWAIPQAMHDWILIVDSDESLEEGLKEEIEVILKNNSNDTNGYKIPRKNLIYGKWVKTCGIYPDYVQRLFRKSKGKYELREVHAHLKVPGKSMVLKHHLIHHDFNNLEDYLMKFQRYQRYELDELVKNTKTFHWKDVTLRPIYMFLWSYIYKAGYKDGFRGFFLSVLKGYYNFVMYSKLWELEWKNKKRK